MNHHAANPFSFGKIISESGFIDREREIRQLVRDLKQGQTIFLLSPRRFGKSSLVTAAFRMLQKQGVRTVLLPVSNYATYGQFLEKFAEKVIRAAGPWEQAKNWMGRFLRRARPQAEVDLATGEIKISFGQSSVSEVAPLAPDIFALPGELAKKGGFHLAICLDEFQQVESFNGKNVEGALRNALQAQGNVGFVLAGSQPSVMEQMLRPKRPFYKSGPTMFLDKIPAEEWKAFIAAQFDRRGRQVTQPAMALLLEIADLIPYDVQRLAHELWDEAELSGARRIETQDVEHATERLVSAQEEYYERLWEQLPGRQQGVLQALAMHGALHVHSEAVRRRFKLGPASTVQGALRALDRQDVIDRYHGTYFFLDPLFGAWIRRNQE